MQMCVCAGYFGCGVLCDLEIERNTLPKATNIAHIKSAMLGRFADCCAQCLGVRDCRRRFRRQLCTAAIAPCVPCHCFPSSHLFCSDGIIFSKRSSCVHMPNYQECTDAISSEMHWVLFHAHGINQPEFIYNDFPIVSRALFRPCELCVARGL